MAGSEYRARHISGCINVNDNQMHIPDLTEEEDNCVYAQFPVMEDGQEGEYFSIKINDMAEDASLSLGISRETELRDESDDDKNDDDDKDDDDHTSKRRETDGVGYFSDTGMIHSCMRTSNCYKRGKYQKGSSVGVSTDYVTDTKAVLMFFRDDKPIHRQWVSLQRNYLYPTLNAWWGPIELTYEQSSTPQLDQGNLSHWIMDKTLSVSNGKLVLAEEVLMAPSTAIAPIPLSDGYFEITIENTGALSDKNCPVIIGLTPAEVGTHRLAGLLMESIGYHSDEGKIFHEDDKSAHNLGENCKCKGGDKMGCGLIYIENKGSRQNQKVIVYFTKNGRHVYHRAVNQPNGGFYPSVTIKHAGDVIGVNMGLSHPSIDVEEWKREAQSKTGGAFSDLPAFTMPDQKTHHDLEDDQLDGIMVQQYRFPEELGGMKTDGTICPSQPLKKPRMIQCTDGLSKIKPFFSMTMSETGYDSAVSIGITRSSQTVGTLPGYLSESVGYSNGGNIYHGARHKTAYFETEQYDKGDTVGCLLEYSGDVHIISFTKNGKLVGRGQVSNSNTKDLMPSIGFKYMPSTVRPKWAHSPSQEVVFHQINLDDWIRTPGLSISGNTCRLKKKGRKKDPQMLTAPHPLTQGQSFYSVKVLTRKSRRKHLSIGISNHSHVASTSTNYRDVRLHSHHRNIITKGITSKPQKEHLDTPAGLVNDVVGCGLLFAEDEQSDDRAKQFVVVYFTVNGTPISHQVLEQPDGGFYPIMSLETYGDKLELDTTFKPPALPDRSAWLQEAQQKIKEHKKKMKALQKDTERTRQNRPASPVERPTSYLNKIKVYIACDAERWNEASYIKAGLDSYGFNAMLLPKDRVAKGSVELDIEPRIKTCHVIVCCITTQYCNSKHASSELKLAKKFNKPILLAVIEKTKWPPAGNIQDTLKLLTTYRIEMYSNFDWGQEQLNKQVEEVKGIGYNAKELHVGEGQGASLLYSDAQRGNKTQNKASDPNALKKAVADADRRKQTSFGNTTTDTSKPPTRQHGNVQKDSTTCNIL